ncbi:S-layer family protein [Chroococcus sp. FPU101]|uniref:beta strand repeat-containing protein n=1 Tax=Chroococcus sp. FPU101 TaxID=1974212 RepID=UPI001A909B0D|nr:Calx-beta domain-containing protein [Chroococcus sp. FPU101]GFE69461.1 hypothetical protein CFPU101_20710 [Chroococcus sp. FPU101]
MTFPAVFQLSSLNGTNGFIINGINPNDESGFSVSNAGDVNGDGFDDLLIGAPESNVNGGNSGQSYVIFGKSGGFGTNFNLSSLNGSNGFAINGIDFGDYSGRSVSSAGDVNGDGFDDIIIGAHRASSTNVDAGQSYVVFGKSGGFTANFNLSGLNGSNGFAINGINIGDISGYSVSGAGDVNGDGFDDLIIGAFDSNVNGTETGQSYVVFGKSGGFSANLNLSSLNGSNGFAINGINPNDYSGVSVSNAGDVNGDGFDDLIIGADGADPNSSRSGQSYVVFGKSGGFSASLNLSTLNGTNGFAINGIGQNDFSGGSVSSAGDVNGDGFDDIIIGAYSADPNSVTGAGQSYVVFGKSGGFGASLNLSTLNGTNGFAINGINSLDRSGVSVSSAGDVNGDGFDDLIIGALRADPNGASSGQSYVVFGKSGGFSASLNLSSLNGTNGFAINGINGTDYSGRSVSSAGDVNGDGFDDLIIGAWSADPNGTQSGQSYVIFGRSTGTTLPSITLAVSPTSVTENGTANLIYTFTRNGSLTSPLTVNYTISGTATRGTDYANIGTSVTFAANSSTTTVTVNPTGDTTVEPNETVILTLANGTGYTIGTTTPVTGTILNDDTRIALAVSPASVTEDGTANLIYTFTRTGVLTNPLTVNYGITGTATRGTDYANIGTSVTFAANSSTARVTVNPTADTTVESNETVILTLANGTGYTIGTTTPVTGTILNDDSTTLPRITLAVSPASVTENGTANLIYTFTRTGSLTNSLTVNYTIGGTATRGTDYANIGTSVTFAANSATARVTVNPTGDTIVEANETVALTLASSTRYTIGTTGAVRGTILNDDPASSFIATNSNDVLTGSTSADSLIFSNPYDRNARITDFTPDDDLIVVSASGFGGGLTQGELFSSEEFIIGTSATTATQRFIYNDATGALLFDAEGTGMAAAIQFATLSAGLALTHEDIFVS